MKRGTCPMCNEPVCDWQFVRVVEGKLYHLSCGQRKEQENVRCKDNLSKVPQSGHVYRPDRNSGRSHVSPQLRDGRED